MVRRVPFFPAGFLIAAFVLGECVIPAYGQAANQTTTQTTAQAPTQAAQASAPASTAEPPMPKDPNALMQLAARVNGLGAADIKPWHLKANYQTFDEDGKPKDTGVFEEWWASPDKYKISYASTGFNQVRYPNGKDTLVTGSAGWPPPAEDMVERFLVHPLPAESGVAAQKYVASDVKNGSLPMKCMRPAVPSGYTVGSAYCFATDIPAIRIEVPYGQFSVLFNGIVTVGGEYVAKQIQVLRASKAYLNVDVTALEFPATIDAVDFVAPAGATALASRRIAVSPGVLAGSLISGFAPEYPADAKAAHVEGTVVLSAFIDKKGEIKDLRVISGNPLLVQAAKDAVYTWRYRPYLLNGEPVEVETQINVVFQLNKK